MTTSIATWTLRYGTTDLPIIAGNFTVDEINVPAVSGTFIVPDSPGLLEQLDPRATPPPRVQITGRRTYWSSLTVAEFGAKLTGDGLLTVADLTAAWDMWTVADVSDYAGTVLNQGFAAPSDTMSMSLHVRRAVLDRRAGTIAVSVASDEALLTDWAPSSAEDLNLLDLQRVGASDSVGRLVNIVMSYAIGRTLTPGPLDSTVPSENIPWTIDMSAWEMIRPILDDAGLKLRVHPDGETWTLAFPGDNFTGGEHFWSFDEVLSATEEYSRTGDWYDSSLLVAEDENTGNDVVAGYPSGAHSRTYRERFPRGSVVSVPQAQNIVTRSVQRGRMSRIRLPIRVGLWMREIFSYSTSPDHDTAGWQVASVSYDITSDIQDITGILPY